MNLREAMRQTRQRNHDGTKKPFSVKFVSFDGNERRCRERSEVINLESVITTGSNHDIWEHSTITVKRADDQGHHYTIHTKLIFEINGEPVI